MDKIKKEEFYNKLEKCTKRMLQFPLKTDKYADTLFPQEEVKEIKEFKELDSYLKKDKRIIENYGKYLESAIIRLLEKYFYLIKNKKRINKRLLKSLSNKAYFDLINEIIVYRTITPIHNLETQTFRLEGNYKKTKYKCRIINNENLSKSIKQKIKRLNERYESPTSVFYNIKSVLVLDIFIRKTEEIYPNSNLSESHEILENIISTIRLFKKGRICRKYTIEEKLSVFSIGGVTSWPHNFYRFGQTLSLNKKEIRQFKKFKKSIDKYFYSSRKSLTIDLALRYFNYIYSRINVSDKIIDLVICLEALYNIDYELKYRLSLRVASLLGKTDSEKEEIYQNMKKIYNLRSAIIHGSKDPNSPKFLEKQKKYLPILEEYTRLSLVYFIKLYLSNQFKFKKEILGKFEETMFFDSKKAKKVEKICKK